MYTAILMMLLSVPAASSQPSCSEPADAATLLQARTILTQELHVMLNSVSELRAFAPDLVELGVKLFGSAELLDAFLHQTDVPAGINYNSVPMRLKQNKGDNSVKRLGLEAVGDGYGLRRVLEKDGVIIDAGGNIGAVTIATAKTFPAFQVLTIEPIPSTYFLLRLNMRLNGVPELQENEFGQNKPGVLAIQRALSTTTPDVKMRYSTVSTQDSLPKGQDEQFAKAVNTTLTGDWASLAGTWQTVKVKTMMLPSFLDDHRVHQVRFLKMDCEGCEFDVIPAMRNFVSDQSKVQHFAAEIHRVKVTGAEDAANTRSFDAALLARGCTPPASKTYFPDGLVLC